MAEASASDFVTHLFHSVLHLLLILQWVKWEMHYWHSFMCQTRGSVYSGNLFVFTKIIYIYIYIHCTYHSPYQDITGRVWYLWCCSTKINNNKTSLLVINPGNTPWCRFILLMDDGRAYSGGKLEVFSINFFGLCLLAGRWHGQLVLLPVGKSEPESCNGQ